MLTNLILLQSETKDLLGVSFINIQDFFSLIVRFSFNLLVITIIVRGLYYTTSRRKDYFFAFVLISAVIFLICFLLDIVSLQIGFALGLFAIFGIIRYRTNPIPIKEMTYLFVVIGISVINGLATSKISYVELVFTNIALILVVYILEKAWVVKKEVSKVISYEKIDLIKPGKRQELIDDLRARTGLDIIRIEIGRIDFIRDTARIRIYYLEEPDVTEEGIETRSSEENTEI
jgi:hypothetical protein